VAWLLRHHPELKPSQISRLIGTTKTTIQAVEDRSHWNSPNIRPRDPVLLGLCSQTDLNQAVAKAQEDAAKAGEPIPEPKPLEPAPEETSAQADPHDLSIFKLPS
jgi:hypothetical protein